MSQETHKETPPETPPETSKETRADENPLPGNGDHAAPGAQSAHSASDLAEYITNSLAELLDHTPINELVRVSRVQGDNSVVLIAAARAMIEKGLIAAEDIARHVPHAANQGIASLGVKLTHRPTQDVPMSAEERYFAEGISVWDGRKLQH